MTNYLEELMEEAGKSGRYVPKAHEQMDREIDKNSILSKIGLAAHMNKINFGNFPDMSKIKGLPEVPSAPKFLDDLTLRKLNSPHYREKIKAAADVTKFIENYKNKKYIQPILDRNKADLAKLKKLEDKRVMDALRKQYGLSKDVVKKGRGAFGKELLKDASKWLKDIKKVVPGDISKLIRPLQDAIRTNPQSVIPAISAASKVHPLSGTTTIVAALLTGYYGGTVLDKELGLSGKIAERQRALPIAEWARPDPDMTGVRDVSDEFKQAYYGNKYGDEIKAAQEVEDEFRSLLGPDGSYPSHGLDEERLLRSLSE